MPLHLLVQDLAGIPKALHQLIEGAAQDQHTSLHHLVNCATQVLEMLTLMEALREEEGNTVEICSDAADFGVPNCSINCTGEWTQWEPLPFYGDTVLDCLRKAAEDKKSKEVK